MVRTYKRKTHQGEWSAENMTTAANKVLTKELTLRRAAELYNVPFTSLQRRVTLSRGIVKTRGGQPILNEEAEKLFADRLLQLATRGFGLTPKSVRKYVFQYAERKQIAHKFNRQLKMAGEDWFHRFMARNPHLDIRKPEGLSRARMNGMTKEKVSEYFTTLSKVIDDNNMRGKPECIYNVDETGIPLNNRPPNVVTQKGSRDVVSITSVERGENVTVLACMNAAGQFIPPFVLFKGVRKRDDFMIGMPPGTQVAMTEKGWVNEDAFKLWINHFNRYRTQGKVILILDGHASHTSLSVVDLCESSDIELVLMPPHTSHALQPLDVSFFKPLKTYYNQHATAWQHSHPEKGITKVAFGGIFRQAWNQAATVGNATKGFEKTGIYPLNPNAVPDTKFVSEFPTTDQGRNDTLSSTSAQTAATQDVQNTSLLPIEPATNLKTLVPDMHPTASTEPVVTTVLTETSTSAKVQPTNDDPQCVIQVNLTEKGGPPSLSQEAKEGETTTQQVKNFTSPTTLKRLEVQIIKEVVPSPIKPTDQPPKKARNVNKPMLHLTSPQSKENLRLKDAKKQENLRKKMTTKVNTERTSKNKSNSDKQQQDKPNVPKKNKTTPKLSKNKSNSDKQQQDKENVPKKNKTTPKLRAKGASSSRDWYCIYCSEKFVHPPVEDWIQCHICEEWCHEKCADRGGVKGPFKCDVCNSNDN